VMAQAADGSYQQMPNRGEPDSDPLCKVTKMPGEAVAVSILSLLPGDSPRLNGENKAHIASLAETESPLPPILVDRRTMRVIDGMHRLRAASLQGKETIDVVFFDGSEDDLFVRAVMENVAHGLPLSQADRRAAAERIVASHPFLSNSVIGQIAGLAAKTVAVIRRRSEEGAPQASVRVGRDGKVRPLDSGDGRCRAAEMLAQQPRASLRDVARVAGISPATVLDVRKRLERGDPPAPHRPPSGKPGPGKPAARGMPVGPAQAPDAQVPSAHRPGERSAPPSALATGPTAMVEKLLRDPSLRDNETGRGMLRLLHANAMGAERLPGMALTVSPHCASTIVWLARQYAKMWQDFAHELGSRARIFDPSAAGR
jgi:ParB-like nuclease domain